MTEIAERDTTTALSITDSQTAFTPDQLDALRQINVDTNRPGDIAVFFHQAKRTGLDPFNREIYMITRSGKPTIQTGIDGFYKIANRASRQSGGTWGIPETLWCGKDGQWRDVWLEDTPPAAAKVTVERDGSRFVVVALTKEYKAQGPLWQKMPARMIAKCAEALGIRKAFPADTSGLYTTEEMQQADAHAPSGPIHGAENAPRQGGRFGMGGNFGQGQPVGKWDRLNNAFARLSITTPDDKRNETQQWATEQGLDREISSVTDLTPGELEAFTQYLENIDMGAPVD